MSASTSTSRTRPRSVVSPQQGIPLAFRTDGLERMACSWDANGPVRNPEPEPCPDQALILETVDCARPRRPALQRYLAVWSTSWRHAVLLQHSPAVTGVSYSPDPPPRRPWTTGWRRAPGGLHQTTSVSALTPQPSPPPIDDDSTTPRLHDSTTSGHSTTLGISRGIHVDKHASSWSADHPQSLGSSPGRPDSGAQAHETP